MENRESPEKEALSEDVEQILLTDESGEDAVFHVLARMEIDGVHYAVLEDAEDEESVMIFRVTPEDDGEAFEPVESEEECEKVFYLFEAEIEDYDFGPAT